MLQDLTIRMNDCFDAAAGEVHMHALAKALLGLTSITRLILAARVPLSINAGTPYNGGDIIVDSIVQLTTLR